MRLRWSQAKVISGGKLVKPRKKTWVPFQDRKKVKHEM